MVKFQRKKTGQQDTRQVVVVCLFVFLANILQPFIERHNTEMISNDCELTCFRTLGHKLMLEVEGKRRCHFSQTNILTKFLNELS